jgi:hypothetical protein
LPELRQWIEAVYRLPELPAGVPPDLLRSMVQDHAQFQSAISVLQSARLLDGYHRELAPKYALERAPNPEGLRIAAAVIRDSGFLGRLFSTT